mgnify:CR=1 FL=1
MLNKKNNIIERALNGIRHCLVEKKLYVPMCPSTNLLWSNDEIGKAIGRLARQDTVHRSWIKEHSDDQLHEQVERNDDDDLMMRAMTSHTTNMYSRFRAERETTPKRKARMSMDVGTLNERNRMLNMEVI